MISRLAADRFQRHRAISCAAMLFLVLPIAASQQGVTGGDPGRIERALGNELRAAQDTAHPMQYQLRKSTPRLTSTKQIIETRDGAVALLLTVNGASLDPSERAKENARLDALLADPNRQRKRKQSEENDFGRVLKVLRALPKAFTYQYTGSESKGSTTLETYAFRPNPKFSSSDLELLVLTAMSGTLTVDASQERVVRLDGRLQQDVDIGWGILGRLNKGGSITIEQADVGDGLWRVVRFQMDMNGRVFFKTRSFDTTEEESQFTPVPPGLSYQQAIEMLRSEPANPTVAGK